MQGAPRQLRCDFRVNPLGIDCVAPCLSWHLNDARRGALQSANQILVATQPEKLSVGQADVWDTGSVASRRSTSVRYGGPPLESRRRYWWTVRTWDRDGVPSPMAEPGWWEMGLLNPTDWRAHWISIPDESRTAGGSDGNEPCRSLYMRKEFVAPRGITRARAYVSGLGCYDLRVNGQPVGDELFAPGWTLYERRIQYQVYDVAPFLVPGSNVVGAVLGNGWWAGGLSLGRGKIERTSAGNLRLVLQLEIEMTDGATEQVWTDDSWRAQPSPILENSFYHGETYDTRLELPGWDRPGFDDGDWGPTIELDDAVDCLVARQAAPIRVTEELPARSVVASRAGTHIIDFGQNHAGRVQLKAAGAPGKRIALRFAETLNEDGTLDRRNLVGARPTDTLVLRGAGPETWEPRFTYRGYRYAEVTGYPGELVGDAVVSQVLHSDVSPAGRFECSDTLLNRVHQNIVWALRSNLMSVPTDCPQRDERLGWLGDGHVIAPTACWNFDMAMFFRKWLRDIRDSQHTSGYVYDVAPAAVLRGPAAPGWGDAIVGLPWTLYRFYDDSDVIEENFAAMRAWVEYMRAHARDGLYECPHELKEDGYGDWVAIEESPKKPIAAAFSYYSTRLLAEMAAIIGRTDEATEYASRARQIRDAFNRAFLKRGADNYLGGTQTANILPLAFGLAPPARRRAILSQVVADIECRGTHLSTGFLGTAYVLPLLSAHGHHELAYRLATQQTYPSWGYMVACGATTMCELWNPDTGDPRMNSWNHFALGTIGQWFFESLGGINLRPAAPVPDGGLSHGIEIRPQPVGELDWVRVEYDSIFGTIRSHWQRTAGRFNLEVTIPPNATARVVLPPVVGDQSEIFEDGRMLLRGREHLSDSEALRFVGFDSDGYASFEAGAGDYAITMDYEA